MKIFGKYVNIGGWWVSPRSTSKCQDIVSRPQALVLLLCAIREASVRTKATNTYIGMRRKIERRVFQMHKSEAKDP